MSVNENEKKKKWVIKDTNTNPTNHINYPKYIYQRRLTHPHAPAINCVKNGYDKPAYLYIFERPE